MAKNGDLVVYESAERGFTYAFGSQAARDAAKAKEPPRKRYDVEIVTQADKDGKIKRTTGARYSTGKEKGSPVERFRPAPVLTIPKERVTDLKAMQDAFANQHMFESLKDVRAALEPHLAPVVEKPTHKVYTAGGHDLRSSWYEHPFRSASGKLLPVAAEPGAGPRADAVYREHMKDPANRLRSMIAATVSERAMAAKFAKMSATGSARMGEPRKVDVALAKAGPVIDSALRSRIEALAKTNPEVSKAIESLNRPEGAKPSEQVTPAKAADAAPRVSGLPDLRDRLSALPKGQLARIAEGLQLRNPSPGAKFSDLSRTAISNAIAFGHTWDGKILSDAELHAAVASSSKRAKPSPKTKAAAPQPTATPAASVASAVPASAEEKRFAEAKRFADMQADIYARNPSSFAAASHHSEAQRGLKAAEQALRTASPPSSGDLTGGSKETAGSVKQSSAKAPAPASDIERRILNAYMESTNGRLNTRGLIADLHAKLPDVPLADLHATLKTMQRQDKVTLYQNDNRAEVLRNPRMADAALHIAGEPRHIVWIDQASADRIRAAAPAQPESSGLDVTAKEKPMADLDSRLKGLKKDQLAAVAKEMGLPVKANASAKAITTAIGQDVMRKSHAASKTRSAEMLNGDWGGPPKDGPTTAAAGREARIKAESSVQAAIDKVSSGLHGTQNPNNLTAIVEGKKARAKPKVEKAPKAEAAPKKSRAPKAAKAAPVAAPAPVVAPVKPVEAAKKPKGYVTLGDGRKMPLDKYTEAWKKAKAMPASAPVRGIPSDPMGGGTAGDVVRELRAGLQDRINRKDPNYGKGRKWDDSWQSDARRLKDTLGMRSEVRPGEAHPVDLRPRIAHRLAEGTPLPPVGGTKKPVRPAKVAAPQAAAPAAAGRRGSPPPTLAARGVQRGKPAANPVVPAPKAAEPVAAAPAAKPSKVGKALGALGPVAIGASAIQAAGEARAAGKSTGEIALAGAKAGAQTTAGIGGFMLAQGGAVHALIRGGMTAAKAVPAVNVALMAGGAIHGAITAKPGERITGAIKGGFDMSLPGMVYNTGVAVKDAAKAWQTPAAAASPSHSPAPVASFQAAQDRFSAMRAAAQATEAGEKKKGWSNAARISAYQHKHPGGTALPYGGAVEPPKPIQLADKKK